MQMRLFWLFALLACPTSFVWGHEFVAAHTCVNPNYEITYEDEEQLHVLEAEVLCYKRCLTTFMHNQADQSKVHLDRMSESLEQMIDIKADLERHAPAEVIEKWKSMIDAEES